MAWAWCSSEAKFCVYHNVPAMIEAMKGAFSSAEHLSPARTAQLATGSASLAALLEEEEAECHSALGVLVLLSQRDQLAVAIEGIVRKWRNVPGVVNTLCRAPYRSMNQSCMALQPGFDSVNLSP